jgi:hypothetical protein
MKKYTEEIIENNNVKIERFEKALRSLDKLDDRHLREVCLSLRGHDIDAEEFAFSLGLEVREWTKLVEDEVFKRKLDI